MRAIAISLVVICHFSQGLDILGVCGVELFFVLSGFLIGGILLRTVETSQGFRLQDLVNFLKRRWYRTLPNYYLFLLLYAAVAAAMVRHIPPVEWFFRYGLFLQNFAWPNPDWIFGQSWSLCVEEWFYLLTAGTLFLTMKAFSTLRHGRAWALAVTLGLFLAVPAILRFALRDQFGDLRTVAIFRLDAIAFGVFMAWIQTRRPGLWNRPATLLALGVAGAGAALAIYGASPSATAGALTLMPIAFALLLPASYRAPRPGIFLGQWVGNVSIWSYSIYMCHSLIYLGLGQLMGYDALSFTGKMTYKVISLALIVLVSALNYRFFEKPMTDLRDPSLRNRRPVQDHA